MFLDNVYKPKLRLCWSISTSSSIPNERFNWGRSSVKKHLRFSLTLAATGVLLAVAVIFLVNSIPAIKAQAPNPIGAWFGIARPCPADAKTDSPDHTAFCQTV